MTPETIHNPYPEETTIETLNGFKVGDRVEVPDRTIGPSNIEALWVRNNIIGPLPYAKIRNDKGQPLSLPLLELRHPQ